MLKSFGLTGRSDKKVDAKGRISVPPSMKKALTPEIHDEIAIILKPDSHLLLFNRQYWNNTIQQGIIDRATLEGGEKTWKVINRLSENSWTSTLDGQSRIMIPRRFLESAGIDKDVAVIGASDRVFVWNPGKYRAWIDQDDIDEIISEIGIL